MRKKGFILIDCLFAAGLAALILPAVSAFFFDSLDASLAHRRRQEAVFAALSCLDAAEADVEVTEDWIRENIAAEFASYDISVSLDAEGQNRQCRAEISWSERGQKRQVSLVRRIR